MITQRFLTVLISFTLGIGFMNAQTPISMNVNPICNNPFQYEFQEAIYNLEIEALNGSDWEVDSVINVDVNTPLFVDYKVEKYGNQSSVFIKVINAPQPSAGDYDIRLRLTDVNNIDNSNYYVDVTVNFGDALEFTYSPSIFEDDGMHVVSTCENEKFFDMNNLFLPKGGEYYLPYRDSIVENGILDMVQYGLGQNVGLQYRFEDAQGCIHEPEFIWVFFDVDSPEITVTNIENTQCDANNGAIETVVVSENDYYSSWNNGVHNSENISDLFPGVYHYTVVDTITGCSNKVSAIVESEGFDIVGNVEDVQCKGENTGEIDITISGGSGNYQIIWSSGHSSTTVTDLAAGVYQVTVKDLDNGCKSYASFEVLEPSSDFTVGYDGTIRPSSCTEEDGKIFAFLSSGGEEPYEFLWNNNATTEELTDVGIGVYSVTVKDNKGCYAYYSTELNLNTAPSIPSWQAEIKDAACSENNGSIVIGDATPGISTETIVGFEWSNGATTKNIYGLAPGVYDLAIKQSDGCESHYQFTIDQKPNKYIPEICIVSVDTATNTNLVVWEENDNGNTHGTDYYNIYRENALSGKYDKVGTVAYDEISVFNDVVASPEESSWKYRMSSVNVCGAESALSSHHKTIHLVMTDVSSDIKRLSWDHYEGLEYFYYKLYRGTDVDGWNLVEDNIPISQLPSINNTIPSGATEVDYIVEVIPTNGVCTADFGKAQDYNSSRSNRPSPIFDPGVGTGDPHNDLEVFESENFKAIVYPNPSNGMFTVEVLESLNENLTMSIIGVDGKIYHSQSIAKGINEVQLSVDSGMYIVQIQRENSLETTRIIIQ